MTLANRGFRRRAVACALLLTGALVLGGIWVGLPARWWPVDAPGTLLGVACLVSGGGLLGGLPWAERAARVTLWAQLLVGCVVCSALAFAASHLVGLYGPVGAGGALLLGVMAALILPYLVGLPAVSLGLLRERD